MKLTFSWDGGRGQRRCPGGSQGRDLWSFAPKTPQGWQVPQPRAGLSPAPLPAPGALHKSLKENLGSPKFTGQKFIPGEKKRKQNKTAKPQPRDFQTSWDLVTQAVNLTASCHLLLVGFTLNFSI